MVYSIEGLKRFYRAGGFSTGIPDDFKEEKGGVKSRNLLPTFGGHPVPPLLTEEQVALAERLARELVATATVPVPEGDKPAINPTEISPEMVKAGRDVIERHWTECTGPLGFTIWEKVLSEVWGAMTRAHRLYGGSVD